MTLKIYGKPNSPYVWLATLTAAHAGVPYEFVPLSKEAHQAESYRSIQPFAESPYMDHDGFILYESRAISRYIAALTPSATIIPSPTASLQERALFEQAASVESAHFNAHTLALLKAHFHDPPLVEKVQEARAALEKSLDGYDRVLQKQRYVAGEEMSVVDLWHLPLGSILQGAGVGVLADEGRWPSVARWWKGMIALPAWQVAKPEAQP